MLSGCAGTAAPDTAPPPAPVSAEQAPKDPLPPGKPAHTDKISVEPSDRQAVPDAAVPDEDPIGDLMAGMSLEDKIWQMFFVYVADYGGSLTEAPDDPSRMPAGGVLYDASNMNSKKQVSDLLLGFREGMPVAPFAACDEEGGRVARLAKTVGTPAFKPMLEYSGEGPETSMDNASRIAAGMAALGFTVDFAPVADVWSNPENAVIGDRAYSSDPDEAAELVAAAVEGFHDGGVACTLKHFPGHGDTAEDSHGGAAYCYKDPDELEACEWKPFRSGIEAGADMVMIGHVTVPELDDVPATFSSTVVTGILRNRLGFEGVIVTDAMRMGGAMAPDGADPSVAAISAGCDMVLCPDDPAAAVKAVLDAVNDGILDEDRIDGSVRRILEMKSRCGLLFP